MKSSLTLFSDTFNEAEKNVSDDPSSYKGLDPRALCTSPEDVLAIIKDPLVHGTWVDLGSGFGHTVITYSHEFPERSAIGIEREEARVLVARTLAEKNSVSCEFIIDDLLHANLPEGDTYFLYFPQGHVLDRILSELSLRKMFTLVVIESHGDLFPRLEKEKWLKLEREVPLQDPRHVACARIYRPSGKRKLAGLHAISFLERFLLIQEKESAWIGESFGLYASGDHYMLELPPRSVQEKDVVKIMTMEELDPLTRFVIELRRLPEVTISTKKKIYSGALRKILVSPAFSVELSGGERVEWEDIEWIKHGNHQCYESSSRLFSLPPAHLS